MKKWLLFLTLPALVLFAGLAWATTYTTPFLDGRIDTDWDPDEVFATQSFFKPVTPPDYTLWITWDIAEPGKGVGGLYIGLDRAEHVLNKFLGNGFDEVISLYVAIDTDQIPGSGATADGYQTVTFSGGHLPEYCYYFTGDGGWYEWSTWDHLGGAWIWNGWRNDGTYYGWPGDFSIDDELTILWNDIGNPTGIAVKVWITYDYDNQPSPPWPPEVLAAWPEDNPVGPVPDLPWSYEFYPGHYYTAPGVPSFAPQPAIDIVPNITDHSVPVTLSSFTATGREGAIEVSWTSQTEVNALAYHLMRGERADGQFAEVARLDAHGNSETPLDYRYVDRDVVAGRTYYYKLADEDYEGNMRYHGPVFAAAGARPMAYRLSPNYPNPFNPSTAIGYEIPEAGRVTLTVYNILGQEVRSLVDVHQEAGSYTVMWDSKDNDGNYLNSGVYFYSLKGGDFTDTRKMVLMR